MTLQELLEKRIQTSSDEMDHNLREGNLDLAKRFMIIRDALQLLRDEAHATGALLTHTFGDPRLHDGPMLDCDGRDIQANNAAGHNKIGVHVYSAEGGSDNEHFFMPTDQAERLIAELSATVMWDKGRYYFGDNGKVAYKNDR